MDKGSETSRRSFLKAGALIAAPVVAAVPAVASVADDARARLARIEDERAVEGLQRVLLRHLNGGADEAQALLAEPGALDVGGDLSAIAHDLGAERELVLAEDGRSAVMRCACHVERDIALTGDSTIERMSRLQGHGSYRQHEERVLTTRFVKGGEGWRIAGAALA